MRLVYLESLVAYATSKLTIFESIGAPPSRSVSLTRALAMVGLFSALYIVSGGIVGLVLQAFSRFPEHLLRGLLMTGVVLNTRRMWSATMMGLVTGLVFVFTVPAPAIYLLPATLVAGLVYDLVVAAGTKYSSGAASTKRLFLAAGVSGAAESVIALSILDASAIPQISLQIFGLVFAPEIVLNIALSIIGASIAISLLLRRTRRRIGPARGEVETTAKSDGSMASLSR